MSLTTAPGAGAGSEPATPPDEPAARYEPPRVDRLGSLADLTLGGGVGIADGFGFAGDVGSLP
jgi:hypothetical protein